MFGKRNPLSRSTSDGPRIDISMMTVKSVTEGHFFLHSAGKGSAFGGHEFDVFGDTDGSYYRDSDEVLAPGLRMHLKVTSRSEQVQPDNDSIGWAIIHKDYVEAVLALDREFVRDILNELRRDSQREIRVAGHVTKEDRFNIDMFMLAAPEQD